MCNFVSWIEYKGKNYFLENKDLTTKQGKKLLDDGYKDDIEGHGAIEHYYPELKGKGVHKECEDFSTPDNFPKEIVDALKDGRLSNIGIAVDILNTKGKQAYEEIVKSAWDEYDKINNSAWDEYEKIKKSARDEYNKIVKSTWDEYIKIKNSARDEYEKIEKSARDEYNKIKKSARDEYEEIEKSAWDEYNKIVNPVYHNIVIQKKYRNKNWK